MQKPVNHTLDPTLSQKGEECMSARANCPPICSSYGKIPAFVCIPPGDVINLDPVEQEEPIAEPVLFLCNSVCFSVHWVLQQGMAIALV